MNNIKEATVNLMAKHLFTHTLQLLTGIIALGTLTACGSDNSTSTNITPDKETITQTAAPGPLQKLTLPAGGTLKAFIVIDNDRLNPIAMTIGNDEARTATAVIPGLSRAPHDIVITYEYTDSNGTITLAELSTRVDLTNGDDSIDIGSAPYDFNFDEDFDTVNNATELLQGTDPYKSDLAAGNGFTIRTEADIPELNATAQANGTLRGFIIIDNGTRREITLTQGAPSANLDIPNLSQTIHDVQVTFEYTNNAGNTYTLYEDTQKADLTLTGKRVIFNFSNLNTASFDEDADGASNFDELLRNTDPLTRAIPFVAAKLNINTNQLGAINFNWTDVVDATFYVLLKSTGGTGPFAPASPNIPDGTQVESIAHVVTGPLFDHVNDNYKLQSCNDLGCTDSETIVAVETFVETIDYLKAENINTQFVTHQFGRSISISDDGNTMAVGDVGIQQDSTTAIDIAIPNGNVTIYTNINGNWVQQTRFIAKDAAEFDGFGSVVALSADGNTLAISANADSNGQLGITNATDTPLPRDTAGPHSGAVYIFTRSNNTWSEQAYIKPDVRLTHPFFGSSLSISNDGNTLAVGTYMSLFEISGNSVFIYTRNINTWSQLTTLTGSNTEDGDNFGATLSLSGDGRTLAVSAPREDSQDTGVDNSNVADTNPPSQTDNSAINSGAVYVFTRDIQVTPNTWIQQAYIKASNTEALDELGIGKILNSDFFPNPTTISLSNDGNTLAIAALSENSSDRNNQNDNIAIDSGAVYIFTRNNALWSQQDYIKAENIHINANFGSSLELNSNGNTLAIGAPKEKSSAKGYNGNQVNAEFESGAAYLFIRDANNKWNQKAYLKANNPDISDLFGRAVSLSGDASILAVGAPIEKGDATGINGTPNNNDNGNNGATYLYQF